MVHSYVTNSVGARIDIGRAQFLMAARIRLAMPDGLSDQDFWDEYCRRHLALFGAPFAPDLAREF